MPFIGTAVIKQLSDRKLRITGLELGENGSGTIGLHGATGTPPDVTLPASFKTEHYTVGSVNVPFQDCINVTLIPSGGGVGGGVIPSVVKTGTTLGDFRMTFTDLADVGPGFEILIEFH